MNFLTIALFITCLPTVLVDFAMPKWKAEPTFRIEDAYKWMYQATRGGEHAVPNEATARDWLDGEWSSIGPPIVKEVIWEPLCPGDAIGRFNLRPFKAAGGRADDLLEAFLASSREYRSDEKNFVAAWNEFGRRLAKKAAGNLNKKEWKRLDAEMRAKSYPAIHHSKPYETAKFPAYRILTLNEMHKIVLVKR